MLQSFLVVSIRLVARIAISVISVRPTSANIPKVAKRQDLIFSEFTISYNINLQYGHWLHSNLSNTLASWSAYRFKRASRTLCWSSSKRWCSAFKPNKKLVVIRTVGSLEDFEGIKLQHVSRPAVLQIPTLLAGGRTLNVSYIMFWMLRGLKLWSYIFWGRT